MKKALAILFIMILVPIALVGSLILLQPLLSGEEATFVICMAMPVAIMVAAFRLKILD